MELSELTAYAEEKFHIHEQRKWADFPGISVLADPNTGKWIALLMRQWDYETGTEIQRCDLKCGQESLFKAAKPYLSWPFRMKGKQWIGVVFCDQTEPDVVFRLFDQAVYSGQERGYTIVLDQAPAAPRRVYGDTALPAPGTRLPAADRRNFDQISRLGRSVPERIRKMMKLYRYGGSSFAEKCRNFYRQGKFMEDYEDNAAWSGEYRRYFPTYHDLNIRQLRGYFTWRTQVRKGNFSPIAPSLAYLYVYELLNGIGTDSPEDALRKMEEFKTGFLDSGLGDTAMEKNLRRWMFEYAVLRQIPPKLACRYADPVMLERDAALVILKNPEESGDEAIFSALCSIGGKKLEESPVVKGDEERGKRLFAAVWRCAWEAYSREGRDFFTACFGEEKAYPWHPLANAVYWEEQPHPDGDYALDECRTYSCRGGVWKERRYDKLYFDRDRFFGLLHEADRSLRRYLKTGHYLRKNPREEWAGAYAEAVIEAERQRQMEEARPKITINLSGLEQIRQDAILTRDSLLTEAEMDGETETERSQQESGKAPEAWSGQKTENAQAVEKEQKDGKARKDRDEFSEAAAMENSRPLKDTAGSTFGALDSLYLQILLDLLQGKSVEAEMKARHLMPSIAADAINEAFFDEIGDNVLECDGDGIAVIEDYREDILEILGGKTDE